MYIPSCGPLLGTCGCGKAIGGPQIPPNPHSGNSGGLLCSAVTSCSYFPFVSWGQSGRSLPPPPPRFCSSYDHHTFWIFCSKISYLPFVPYLSKCSTSVLKFQYHLEAAHRSWGRISGPSLTRHMAGGTSGWLAEGC